MIKIIDFYSGNRVNLEQIAAEYTGVIFKAGQGQYPDVPRVHPEWWKLAKDVGLLRGWYWLVDGRYRPSFQVEAMKKATDLDFGELGLWCDCEKPVLSMKDRDYLRLPYAGWRGVYDFMYGVQQTRASQFNENLPGIYTSPGAFKLIFGGASIPSQQWFAHAPLWTAQYYYIYREGISKPKMYGKWDRWTLWQYRENPDINIFNGTDEEFYQFFRAKPAEPPCPKIGCLLVEDAKRLNDSVLSGHVFELEEQAPELFE